MADRANGAEFTPDAYPPFPESLDGQTVKLATISLKNLLHQHPEEEQRVFESCSGRGFFYLDLSDCETGTTIRHGADEIAGLGEQIGKLPMDEKMKYLPKGSLFGYKPIGSSVTDKQGTRDTAEFFNISKNDMIVPDNQMTRQWPTAIMDKKAMLAEYVNAAHSVGLLLLAVLSRKLGIDPKEFACRHRLQELSGHHIRITRGPPRKTKEMLEIQTPSHTDFGSVTILMNWLGGLQVWSESSRQTRAGDGEPDVPGEWLWVRPKRGCAIVNMGDAAVKFSNGVFCSGRHRVVPAPEEQGLWPRYSVVYFVRPEDKCLLKQLRGPGIPDGPEEAGIEAKEWILQQSRALGNKIGD